MRISDWSSDVCSSDLLEDLGARALRQRQHVDGPDDAGLYRVHRIALVMDRRGRAGEVVDFVDVDLQRLRHVMAQHLEAWVAAQVRDVLLASGGEIVEAPRSEERRVGKEWVSTCRS